MKIHTNTKKVIILIMRTTTEQIMMIIIIIRTNRNDQRYNARTAELDEERQFSKSVVFLSEIGKV